MSQSASISDDYLYGIAAIAEYLGHPWNPRRVRYAREIASLPIRKKPGIGIYGLKSELSASLSGPDSLPPSKR